MTQLSIDDLPNWNELSPKQQLLILRQERARRLSTRKIDRYFPDTGPLRRDLYQKHLEFFRAGKTHRQRCFMAANRVGKTESGGGYEMTCHLTGEYPHWWEGRRFERRPIQALMAGRSQEATRDILQLKMIGPVVYDGPRKSVAGTGIIPGDALGAITWKQGVANLADTIKVRHSSGGWSTLGLKSYEQGSGSVEGFERDVIWLDEEPPMDFYNECLIRIMTVGGGILYLTFTPLAGISEVVQGFLPQEMRPAS